jgi:hypothetical protein
MPQSPALLADQGRIVARLGRALRGYFHPPRSAICSETFARSCASADATNRQDKRLRGSCLALVDLFAAETAPALTRLRAQVVHGDAGQLFTSPRTLLVDNRPATLTAVTQKCRSVGVPEDQLVGFDVAS